MSVDRAAYWKRTLQSFLLKEVEVQHDGGLTTGLLLELGLNHVRVGVGGIVPDGRMTEDVRYDLIRMVAGSWTP